MKILRYILTSILSLFTLSTILFLLVISVSKFYNKSILGDALKNIIIRHPKLVNFINLNEPGDYKYHYYDSKYSFIDVNIIALENIIYKDLLQSWLNEIFTLTVNKKANITLTNSIQHINKDVYNNNDLNTIREMYLTKPLSNPSLNIVFLTSYKEKPGSVGVVIHRDTIFIFENDLNKLTDNAETLKQLEKSTIMHEWGHLLGLEHNINSDCVMSEKVEVYDKPPKGKDVATKYCLESLLYFQKMNNQY